MALSKEYIRFLISLAIFLSIVIATPFINRIEPFILGFPFMWGFILLWLIAVIIVMWITHYFLDVRGGDDA